MIPLAAFSGVAALFTSALAAVAGTDGEVFSVSVEIALRVISAM